MQYNKNEFWKDVLNSLITYKSKMLLYKLDIINQYAFIL